MTNDDHSTLNIYIYSRLEDSIGTPTLPSSTPITANSRLIEALPFYEKASLQSNAKAVARMAAEDVVALQATIATTTAAATSLAATTSAAESVEKNEPFLGIFILVYSLYFGYLYNVCMLF